MTQGLTTEQATETVLAALGRVAPEIDLRAIDPDEELTSSYDIDSMDFLTIVENVSAAVHHDIPERDYPRLVTLSSFAAYLVGAADGQAPAPSSST